MMASPSLMHEYASYVCPTCKGPLDYQPQALCCAVCGRTYPIAGSIPDFLVPVMDQISEPLIQRVNQADRGFLKRVAGIYEGRFWYPLVISLYLGRNTTSLAEGLSPPLRLSITPMRSRSSRTLNGLTT